MAVVLGGVEGGDLADAGFAGEEVFPEFLPADAHGRNNTQPSNNNSSVSPSRGI